MSLWRIRATVDDRPGYLSVLTAGLALSGVNILAVQVHTTEAGAVDDFLVVAPDTITADELIAAVEKGRGRDCWVARTEVRGLVDQPTWALAQAARLVREPDALGAALGELLGTETVTWQPAPAPPRSGVGTGALAVADPSGGSFVLRRSAPTFTPAEYARAQALVEVAATVTRQEAERVTLLLPDGAEIEVRQAVAADLPAVLELHASCSAQSLRRRYHGSGTPAPGRLGRLIDPGYGLTLLAVTGAGRDERVVAMANLIGEGEQAEGALLVQDDWQRRGLGTGLLRRLGRHGERIGYAALVLHTGAENTPMLRTLRRLHPAAPLERDAAMVTVTVPLAGTPAQL